MIHRNIFLFLGIFLSIASKLIQFTSRTLLGDLLILPAGPFFVLAILLSLPQFQKAFRNPDTRGKAVLLAALSSLTVLCFQLFTILAFGYSNPVGYLFIIPVVIFAILAIIIIRQLKIIP